MSLNMLAMCMIYMLLVIQPLSSFATESVTAPYFAGTSSITVDGDLSDWREMDIPSYDITSYLNYKDVVPPANDNDLSASFKCFADNEFFYVAVEVTDDIVIIGEHAYGDGWNDDAVEICFDGDLDNISKPYFDDNDGQVRFTAGQDGVVLIEGSMPYFFEMQPPYFWEARGVMGQFSRTSAGYVVEAAIPVTILGSAIQNGSEIGLNVRIFDDDHEINGDLLDKGLSWAVDPQNTSFWKTQYYNRIAFTGSSLKATSVNNQTTGTYGIIDNKAREIVLELNVTNQSQKNSVIDNVMRELKTDNWAGASNALSSVGSQVWSVPLQGVIDIEAGNYADGVQIFERLNENAPDSRVSEWSRKQVDNILTNIRLYRDIDNYKLGLKALSEIIPNLESRDLQEKAQCLQAQFYYYLDDLTNAEDMSKQLLSSSDDPKIKLDARMVLLSIERKRASASH